jgi:hypothetical protein
MFCRSMCRAFPATQENRITASAILVGSFISLWTALPITAQEPRDDSRPRSALQQSRPGNNKVTEGRAKREAALVEMLSGATLEGSFTSTGPENDPTKLSREKYMIGEVKKIADNVWLISARIQYGEHDVTLPVTVPIHWAGDTPVIVVDNQSLPGFGTVSARVMFFADHYAGYWKHGQHGGHLFGTIQREGEPGAARIAPDGDPPPSSNNSSRVDSVTEEQRE